MSKVKNVQEFNVFNNIMVIYMTFVCICCLKLWKLNCNARYGQYNLSVI